MFERKSQLSANLSFLCGCYRKKKLLVHRVWNNIAGKSILFQKPFAQSLGYGNRFFDSAQRSQMKWCHQIPSDPPEIVGVIFKKVVAHCCHFVNSIVGASGEYISTKTITVNNVGFVLGNIVTDLTSGSKKTGELPQPKTGNRDSQSDKFIHPIG